MKKGMEPAFPQSFQPQKVQDSTFEFHYVFPNSGLSVRQYAAIKAMQGHLANQRISIAIENAREIQNANKFLAEISVKSADALLEELEK